MKMFALSLTFAISFGIDADPVTPAGNSDNVVPVEVAVRTSTGRGVDQAYVAFVSPDRPNSQPSAEAVLPRGVAKLHLKAGTYTVFALSRGMQETSRSVNIDSRSRPLVFELKPAASIGGVVRDESGNPIADATVRHMRAVGPVAIGQVSALARRHFSDDWVTRTDADGVWTLAGRADGAVPVLIEAPGYASEHRYFRAAETHTTTLRPGSKLRVMFDRAENDRYVTLIRHTTPDDAASHGWESVAWARPIESTTIIWESLPAGMYSVVVRYVEARRFAHATTVGTVEVGPDTAGELRVAMPPSSPIDRDAHALFFSGVGKPSLAALQALASTEGAAEEVKYALETVSGGTVAYLRTKAPIASLVLMTRSAIYAAQSRASSPQPDATPIPTVPSARADVSIRIETTDGSPLPRWATAQFGGCDFPERFIIAAPVSKEGAIELPYPTACRVVVLAISPFAPVVLRTSPAPGTRKAFGPYALKLAASADIHVVRQPSGTPVANAPVRALLRDRRWRTDVSVAEGVADGGGKLRLDGLPSDLDVVFEARVPSSEASAEMLANLEVGRIEQVQLRIPEPATLVVVPRLAAEVLEKFPQATIYSVVLEPVEESTPSAQAARRVADVQEAAEAVFKSIRPGAWRVIALVRAAGAIQPILVDTISLRPGDVRRLQIAVAPAIIEGRVMSGTGKGTEAHVSFGDPPSAHSVRRFTRTDSLGRFTILLPKRGTYSVEVSPIEDEDRTTIQLGEIAFTDPTRPVSLYLPTGVIRVRVKERDQPVEGAAIKAVYWRESAFAPVVNVERYGTTAKGGEAVLESLTVGRWLIQAVSPGSGYRAEAAVTLEEGDSPPVVTLDLQPPIVIQGLTRTSGSSAVTSARVNCLFVGQHGVPQVEQSDSDAEGRFSIALSPPPPAALYCGVTTESGHIGAYLLSPSNADLVLPAETGSLTIPDWADKATRDALWLVARDGRMFNLSWFTAKAGKRWGALTVPRLPAGSWKIVRISSSEDWFRLAGAGGNALSPIAEFRIEEGEMKTVHLDSE